MLIYKQLNGYSCHSPLPSHGSQVFRHAALLRGCGHVLTTVPLQCLGNPGSPGSFVLGHPPAPSPPFLLSTTSTWYNLVRLALRAGEVSWWSGKTLAGDRTLAVRRVEEALAT
jgi:hypothetical protein